MIYFSESGKSVKKGNIDIRKYLGEGQVLRSANQKVIVNGVLKCVDKKDSDPEVLVQFVNDNKPSCSNDSLDIRTSVSAINTAGKISDKDLLRQKHFAELMLSDSDDEDLFLCDGPLNHSTTSKKSPKIDGHLNHSTTSQKSPKIDNSKVSSSLCQSNIVSIANEQVPNVAAVVRNIWANKQFQSTLKPLDPKENLTLIQNSSQGHRMQEQISKKRLSKDDSTSSRKKFKTDTVFDSCKEPTNNGDTCSTVLCPVCSKSIPTVGINQHLDTCLDIC